MFSLFRQQTGWWLYKFGSNLLTSVHILWLVDMSGSMLLKKGQRNWRHKAVIWRDQQSNIDSGTTDNNRYTLMNFIYLYIANCQVGKIIFVYWIEWCIAFTVKFHMPCRVQFFKLGTSKSLKFNIRYSLMILASNRVLGRI